MTRTAIVTGSAQGIGRAVAEAMLGSGWHVVGFDRASQPDATFDARKVDLQDEQALSELVAEVAPVMALVNNAAVLIEKPVMEVESDDFARTVAVNLRAPFLLAQLVLPGMVDAGWGRMINVSSVGARTGGVSQSCVYAMTKAGLIAMTKNLARNYGPHGITVNAVAPGAIDTPMVARQREKDPELFEQIAAGIPARRFGAPDDVAAAVAFLAGDAAAFINGVTLDVNGGWVMV